MPVVLVTGAALDRIEPVLAAVNTAIARQLGLNASDVYSSFSPATSAMLGDDAVRPWPVAIVHGGARPAEQMKEALVAVRDVLAATWRCAPDAVWAQWVVAD